MKIKTKFFCRGVHIDDKKSLSAGCPIRDVAAPDSVAIALSQHIGKPAKPVVAVGDSVERGALIAEADGAVSANVFASVSGKVIAIERRPLPRGGETDCIVIENDGENREVSLKPLQEITPDSVRERVREAGIVGMGGAGFPTAVKLSPKTPVDTLIVNGAECEPYLTCDHRLMIEKTDEIAEGAKLLALALGVERVIVAIELNKPDAIAKFDGVDGVLVAELRKRYPMGSEKHLIYSCTGRRVPPGKLPADVGVIVENVATALAVYEAVKLGKPLVDRVMTVSGEGVKEPANLRVPLGTSYRYLLDVCGGETDDASTYIAGGPMMGATLLSTDFHTRKTDSGLLVLTARQASIAAPTACIHCGRCAEVCPMHLLPMDIDFYTLAGDYDMARDRGGVLNCIECGTCAYVCPANRALVQSIQMCKQKLREKR